MYAEPRTRALTWQAAMANKDVLFDKRAAVVGIAALLIMLAGATWWQVAYRDRSIKSPKLKDFEFSPKPPEFQKPVEMQEPRDLMPERFTDQPELQEQPQTPLILMSTDPQEVADPVEVVKTTKLELTTVDIKVAKLDVQDTLEKVDETADLSQEKLTPIAVLTAAPADLYAYEEPETRPLEKVSLVHTARKSGTTLKITPPQIGEQDAKTIGELGPVDINLLGSGDYLSALGRSGMEIRTAVDAALRWLALHQEPEGWWHTVRWDRDDAPYVPLAPDASAKGVGERSNGLTGFALLALLGGGNNLRKGEYRLNVYRGVQWLISQQDPKTGFLSQNMYEHAIATIALCEAFGRSPDESVGLAARRAVDACVGATAKDGGWRYAPNPESSDMSVTSWFLQALKTARLANIKFDYAVYAKGLAYLDQCTDRGAMAGTTGAVGYAYSPSLDYKEGSRALTCAGMVIRQFNGMGVNHPVLVRGAELTKKQPPKWEAKDFYYWYYATYAMHNMGGEWRLWWNRRIRDTLLDHQARKGHQAGSWNPEADKWCQSRVYCTALGALCLEVYYRYGEALQSFGTVAELSELQFR